MASVSLLSSSSSSLLFNARPVSARSPSASLTCTRISASSVAGPTTSARPGLLHCSFMPASSSLSFPSSLSGSPLQFGLSSSTTVKTQKRRSLVVRAGKKYALCQTKRNRSRKSLARTHGFRVRMRTTSGRALLKRRRAKGRWVLCPKSNPNSGKRHL